MSNAGRKSRAGEWLTNDGLVLLEGWARDGLTDKEIAKKIGINNATLCEWKNKYPQLTETLKKGRKPIDSIVENTFFNTKLQPQTVEETTQEKTIHRDADGNITGTTEHVRKTTRYIPADTTAMIFYLKCRIPGKYNDKINVTVDDRNGQLADLINGLKNNVYTETVTINGTVADGPTEKN